MNDLQQYLISKPIDIDSTPCSLSLSLSQKLSSLFIQKSWRVVLNCSNTSIKNHLQNHILLHAQSMKDQKAGFRVLLDSFSDA
jgi:hypothetical protein